MTGLKRFRVSLSPDATFAGILAMMVVADYSLNP
jgi:hypothetical protein